MRFNATNVVIPHILSHSNRLIGPLSRAQHQRNNAVPSTLVNRINQTFAQENQRNVEKINFHYSVVVAYSK